MTIERDFPVRNFIGGYVFNVTCHDCLRTDDLEEEKRETPPKFLGTGLGWGKANGVAIMHEEKFKGAHRIKVTPIIRGGIKEYRVSL